MKKLLPTMLVMSVLLGGLALANVQVPADSVVQGQQKMYETPYPPHDMVVNGHYTTENTDQVSTETRNIVYRGTLSNEGYLTSGWIKETAKVMYEESVQVVTFLTVHKTDPRFEGECDEQQGPCWQTFVYAASGTGNLA